METEYRGVWRRGSHEDRIWKCVEERESWRQNTEYGGVYTETHCVLDNETMITRPSLSGGSR